MAAKRNKNQEANALISVYEKAYSARYSRPPSINRYRDRWGFLDMLEDLGYDVSKETIEYYLETNHAGHPLIYLFRNYDAINERKIERERDRVERLELRKRTEQRLKELEAKNGDG